MAALNAELTDVRRRLDDRQKCDDERQKEFDELMLSAKKHRQDEEVSLESHTFISVLSFCHVDFMTTFFVLLTRQIVVE